MPTFKPKTRGDKRASTMRVIDKPRNIFLCFKTNINFYLLKPLEKRNRASFPSPTKLRVFRKILVIKIAESMETATPKPRVRAKPLISEVPNQKRITAVSKLEMLESRIESQAREKPAVMAWGILLPARISSLIRSKISTFASTAMPMEIMKPAIPAAVRVTGKSLKRVKIMEIKILKAIIAISPGNRYQRIKNNATNKNPIIAALTPAFTALSPKIAPIVLVERIDIGTGRAPEFKYPTSCFASAGVKLPEITACPFGISSRTTGLDLFSPSK